MSILIGLLVFAGVFFLWAARADEVDVQSLTRKSWTAVAAAFLLGTAATLACVTLGGTVVLR